MLNELLYLSVAVDKSCCGVVCSLLKTKEVISVDNELKPFLIYGPLAEKLLLDWLDGRSQQCEMSSFVDQGK